MFTNNLPTSHFVKIAWRNIRKNSWYSFINIIGLAMGIAFTLLIVSYIWSEYSINRDLKNADNQYIIQSKWKDPNLGIELTTFGPLAKALYTDFPHLVKNYYRWDGISSNVSIGDKAFREGIQIGDSTLLDMYGFSLVQGDLHKVFDGPYSLLLTDEKAIKYFGHTDVVGKTLTIENFSGSRHAFLITGVLKKPMRNSVTWITADNDNQFFVSASNIGFFGRDMETWENQYIASYIELQPQVQPEQVLSAIHQLVHRNVAPALANNVTTYLKPLNDYYLSAFNGLVRKLLYALCGVAFFILIMAIINFINLSISHSTTRIKEIGIRKVMGGRRGQLIIQFLIESILITFMATLLAIGIAEIVRPLFQTIMNKEIPSYFSYPFSYSIWPISFVLVIGSIAGMYPAFLLSAVESVDSLKGKFKNIGDKVLLRKSLVGFQYATAVIVLASTIIISKQVDYFLNKDLGFDKEFIVSAALPRDWTPAGIQKMTSIRDQFKLLPDVKNISLSYAVLDGNSAGSIRLYRADRDSTLAVASTIIPTDEYFASTYTIPIRAGTFYSLQNAAADSSKIVINETQAKALGWQSPDEAINKQLKMIGNSILYTIAGVTEDFNFGSLNSIIPPVTFVQVHLNPIYRYFSFKLNHNGNLSQSLDAIQNKWNELMPGTPFEYTFMDEKLSKLYTTELQLKKASYVASFLAMLIVLLGVLGMIGLSLQRKTKEIGIRKVLGATTYGILVVFLKEFITSMLVAGLFAGPIAYVMMSHWLKAYAYKIDLTVTPFLFSICTIFVLTILLICMQTFNTANKNPIKSLRTE